MSCKSLDSDISYRVIKWIFHVNIVYHLAEV